MSIRAKELLVEAACAEQAAKGMLPSPTDNERYLVDLVNRMDRRRADAPSRPLVRDGKKPGAFAVEAERRARRHGFELTGGWQVDAARRPLALGGAAFEATTKVMGLPERRLRDRLRLLRSKPEWADRLKRINPLALQGAAGKTPEQRSERRLAAVAAVRAVIEASNTTFGHWAKDPAPAPVVSYEGQVKRG